MAQMITRVAAAALAAATLAYAGAAGATTYSFTVFLGGGGTQTGGFSHVVTTPTFSDVAQFTLTAPGSFDSQVSTILLGGIANVNFTSVFLDVMDAAHTFTVTPQGDGTEKAVLSTPVQVSAGPHQIFINGALIGDIGSYSGTMNVAAAVPEPATWAMMILGMAMVGAGLRLRRRTSAPAIA
jgi:hypothetical protein